MVTHQASEDAASWQIGLTVAEPAGQATLEVTALCVRGQVIADPSEVSGGKRRKAGRGKAKRASAA
jgi:hypothetical protein